MTLAKISQVYRDGGLKALSLKGSAWLWWRVPRRLRQTARRLLVAVEKRTGLVDRLGLLPRLTPDEQMEILMARSEELVRELGQKVSGPRVLFIAPRGLHYDLVLQSCLAYRLMYDGAYCSFLICQNLPKCNKSSIQSGRDPRICLGCEQRNTRFLDIAGLPYVRVGDLVSDALRVKAKAMVSGLTLEDCQQFEYKAYPLGRILRVAVARYLLRATFDEEERDEAAEVYRDFLYGGIVLLEAYLALIAQSKPDVIVMVNGKLLWSAVAQAIADRLDIRTVGYEDMSSRFIGRTWYFSHNKPVVDKDFNDLWKQYKDVPLTPKQNQRLDKYLDSRRRPGLYYREMETDVRAIRAILSANDNERPFTLFSNVTWDSATLGRDVAFASMFDWILGTVRHFVDSGHSLILRVHPAEGATFDGVRSRERVQDAVRTTFSQLPENIKIIPGDSPISSYALLLLSHVALVYNSTIGWEAVLDGMPAIVAGDAHYRGKGFTYDVASLSQYYELLDNIDTLTVTPSQIELARRYAYLYFFQLPIQIDLWETNWPHGVDRLKIGRLHDLAPGKIRNLDIVAEGILHQTDLVIPR